MNSIRKFLLALINRIGQAIPKKILRRIADFPGVLRLFEKLSANEFQQVSTPEGYELFINPLFHANLLRSGKLGEYEPDIRGIIIKYARPGMAAYDVGANVGIFSFLFASIVGEQGIVYSFEPEENNYRCLEKSLERYNGQNIILDKRAVGASEGTQKFDRRGGAFSGRLIGDAAYDSTGNIRVVETIRIDHAVKTEGYRVPDILKIDVEGNEGMVLEGMQEILKSHSPIVICELHTHLGESSDPVTDLLIACGYTISNVKDVLATHDSGDTASNSPMESHIVAVKTHTNPH